MEQRCMYSLHARVSNLTLESFAINIHPHSNGPTCPSRIALYVALVRIGIS